MQHKEVRHEKVQQNERQNVPNNTAAAVSAGPEASIDLVIGFPGALDGYRFGDGRAAIIGADLVNTSGESVRAAARTERLVLRISFRVNAQVASPIAGFLVRNYRGENIFGTNTARENYPLPPMAPGDANNIDFHWSIPDLAPGAYRISLGVADGNIEDYQMCDYIEDALELNAAPDEGSRSGPSPNGSRGYFRLHCAAVTIHRNQRCK